MYRAFVSCIVRSLRVSCIRSFAFSIYFVRFMSFVLSCIVSSFRVLFVRFVYVRFSYRSCEVFVVCFSVFSSFAFGAYCKLIRSTICNLVTNPVISRE